MGPRRSLLHSADWRVSLWITVPAIALMSCGLFETRDPQDPSESNVPWRQPTQASYVVENIKNTLEGVDLSLYARTAAQDSFVFYADPTLLESDPNRYEDWFWDVEEQATRRLFQSIEEHWGAQDSAAVIDLNDEEWLVIEADSAIVQYSYSVVFHHGKAGVDTTGEGSLRWRMIRSPLDRLWYMAEWRDFALEGTGGWGSIKGGFRE